ncbi:Kinesin- motor protein [Entomophthora muscae]|uniref:Kinesin- motor protein n=1 Tax=Entomophthora muscae TaxID=34485 RepID=A0ACC2SXZ0_9FUNG|nr:Kinesin- motor protein [Entomophthora muscae]
MLEIYNEEVGDLLSLEKTIPKLNLSVDGNGKLQIQGLEEIIVDDVQRGIALLKAGSSNRHCSATDLNAKSSRSHCIFTVTVRIKVTLPDSPDVLKEGKLHLVDLAGSEDARSSGAVNIQLREAGAINQSLLALGRVINALVAKEETNGPMHIPYRESKLTRILQDSLGGQTKTCLIATISSCKSTLDETNSTLKYAAKAMRIANTPTANQRIAPISEIRRLKEEVTQLRALYEAALQEAKTRVTHEEHNTLKTQYEERESSMINLQQEVSLLKGQCAKAVTERDDALANLETTNDALAKAQESLEASQLALRRVEDKFGITESELEEKLRLLTEKAQESEVLKEESAKIQAQLAKAESVNAAYAENEAKLHNVSKDLGAKLKSRTNEAELLQGKIERLTSVEFSNRNTLMELKKNASSLYSELATQLQDVAKRQSTFSQGVENQLLELMELHIKGGKAEFDALELGTKELYNVVDLVKQELCVDNGPNGLASRLEETCKKIEAASQACIQLPLALKDSQKDAAEATKTYIAKISMQYKKVTDTFDEHFANISLWLQEHRLTIERLISDVHHNNQQEVVFWKSKTEQLQLSLEKSQRDQSQHIEQLKSAILASIDSYSIHTNQLFDNSSRLISEAITHTKDQEAKRSTVISASSIYTSLDTISDKQEQRKVDISSATKCLYDEAHSLATNSLASTNPSCQLNEQLELAASELSKECAAQRSIAEELQTKRSSHALEKLDADIKAFGEKRKSFLEQQTGSIDCYSNSMEEVVTTFTTNVSSTMDTCLDLANQANQAIQTTIPKGLKSDIPTCKTPTQIQPDNFCQHWERTNIDVASARFDSSACSSSTLSPV